MVGAGSACPQCVLAAPPGVLYDRPSSSRRCAVSDPQFAVFETAIADRQVIVAQMRPTAGIRPENIVPILQSRSPTKHA